MAKRREKRQTGVPDNPATPGVDESTETVEVDEPLPAISEEDQAVIDEHAEAVAESQATLDKAQAELNEAKANHDAAVTAATPKAVFGKHILVDVNRSGDFAIHNAPKDWERDKPRRLTVQGKNVEVVGVVDAAGQSDDGVWQYRAM